MFALRPGVVVPAERRLRGPAEHESAHLVDEHPDWETTPYRGAFTQDFADYDSLADLFRQIGFDERLHKLESELRIRQPRFR